MNKIKIFASIIDDGTRQQINELSRSEAYKDCTIRVMPDCHSGKGCTIGSVIQYKDKLIPNTVGVDIGCGMSVTNLGKVNIDLEQFDDCINNYIPAGFNVHTNVERQFPLDFFIANIRDKDYILKSIGTLGGGNHFIELDRDNEDNIYLVIHTGSRNLGVQVCEYWQNIAIQNICDVSYYREALIKYLKQIGREKDIQSELKKIITPNTNKELAYLSGDNLNHYIHDMTLAQNFARYNRGVIRNTILTKLSLTYYESFDTIHNYVENGIIRKGAVSANKGELLIIPINMRDGSLICMGKGNSDWLNSAPHGAGRIMSRNKAFESLNLEDFKSSMNGIYTTSVCESTIDESPMVYKPIEQILTDIKPTVDLVKIIKPIYNFKAK